MNTQTQDLNHSQDNVFILDNIVNLNFNEFKSSILNAKSNNKKIILKNQLSTFTIMKKKNAYKYLSLIQNDIDLSLGHGILFLRALIYKHSSDKTYDLLLDNFLQNKNKVNLTLVIFIIFNNNKSTDSILSEKNNPNLNMNHIDKLFNLLVSDDNEKNKSLITKINNNHNLNIKAKEFILSKIEKHIISLNNNSQSLSTSSKNKTFKI